MLEFCTCGKIKLTKAEAKRQAGTLTRSNRGGRKEMHNRKAHVYRCPESGCWHLTSRRPAPGTAKGKRNRMNDL